MIAVALHAEVTRRSAHPESRKRIRLANAWISLVLIPMLVIGVSALSPDDHPREWALVWMASFGLIVISVGLAILDALNTLRLLRRARKLLREELASDARRRLASTSANPPAGERA